MNVNGLGGAVQPQQADKSVFQARMQQAFAPVAQLFGESTDQLMSELQSGSTNLTDLAKTKGISQTDLVNAIKQGVTQTSLNDTQLTNIATRIADHKHGHHHHRTESAGGAQDNAAGSVAL